MNTKTVGTLTLGALSLPLILVAIPAAGADGCFQNVLCNNANLPVAGCQATWIQNPSGTLWIGEASCPADPTGDGAFTCWYVDTINGWVPVVCTPPA
jgi:hypothetical protein